MLSGSRYDELTTDEQPWLEGLFEGAQQAIRLAVARLNTYIATKVSAISTYQHVSLSALGCVLFYQCTTWILQP
jgi:hypothetical protein